MSNKDNCIMGWLSKIFKGSSHQRGQYHGQYGDDNAWDGHSASGDVLSDFDKEEIECAIAISLVDEDQKGKKVIDEEESEEDLESHLHVEEDESHGESQSHTQVEEDETQKSSNSQSHWHIEEDEQLAKAIQESLNMASSPPRYDHLNHFPPFPYFSQSGYRTCIGCRAEIGHGRFLSCMGGVWHPECFRCHGCNQPISDYEFSMSENHPYHKSCYKEKHHPKCDVCKNFIPTNAAGLIEYRAHPFWLQKYCPSHEHDGTPRCCSCERMEPIDTRYLLLDDGRKLCLECLDSSIMDTHECQPLYLEIQEFYEGLMMKVEQQVPMLLVERQALNEAMEGEKKGHHHLPETRGLCLSEEQVVSSISKRPKIGGYRIIDMFTEPYRLTRRCEVTAILVLYGLPRLLTGSILAHEMMHAWLRLKGFQNLAPDVEEGICQVLAHMWLDSEILAGSSSSGSASSSTASCSTATTPSSSSDTMSSKKGKRSQFERKLGEFFKHQIEADTSEAYGDGFRAGNQAVLKYGLRRTLDHIQLTGSFP